MDRKVRSIVQLEYKKESAKVRVFFGGEPSCWYMNKKCLAMKKNPPGWQSERKPALPPYNEDIINFYREKLIKLKLTQQDHEGALYFWEAKHCEEVLASHRRLLDMEHDKNILHDNKNTPTILSSD